MKRKFLSLFYIVILLTALISPIIISNTVLAAAPTVLTVLASAVDTTSAQLNGNLTGLGGAGSVVVSFEYGLTTSYGSTITAVESPMVGTGTFHAHLTGLTSGEIYYFRAKAVGTETAYGYQSSFKATTSAPDSPDSGSIISARAFKSIYKTDDILFVLEYSILYTTKVVPGLANYYFEAALYDVGGSTLVTTPPRSLYYYGYNLTALYFDDATSPAASTITWGNAYVLKIKGTDLFGGAPPSYTHTMSTTEWINTTAAANLSNLKTYLALRVTDLASRNGVTYTTTSATGTVLNSDGRSLVLAAIPSIDTKIPELFQLATQDIVVTQPTATGSLQTTLSIGNQLGTALSAAFTNFGSLLHVSGQQVALAWVLMTVLIIVSIVFLNTGNIVGAGVVSIPMILIGMWVGAVPIAFIFVTIIIMVLFIGYYLIVRGT